LQCGLFDGEALRQEIDALQNTICKTHIRYLMGMIFNLSFLEQYYSKMNELQRDIEIFGTML